MTIAGTSSSMKIQNCYIALWDSSAGSIIYQVVIAVLAIVDNKVSDADAAKVKGYDGNIVVRVREGGSQYYVMTTSDSDGKMTVKNVSGPYKSR